MKIEQAKRMMKDMLEKYEESVDLAMQDTVIQTPKQRTRVCEIIAAAVHRQQMNPEETRILGDLAYFGFSTLLELERLQGVLNANT